MQRKREGYKGRPCRKIEEDKRTATTAGGYSSKKGPLQEDEEAKGTATTAGGYSSKKGPLQEDEEAKRTATQEDSAAKNERQKKQKFFPEFPLFYLEKRKSHQIRKKEPRKGEPRQGRKQYNRQPLQKDAAV